jgi:metal-dependent amidase/aminoacylase/carboxypeptidase family protein
MFHPWNMTGVAEKDLGCTAFRIEFKGQAAHAAADPWNGRNALDAAVLFYNSVSLLRQQLPSGVKLHCILPEAGEVLNIIPDRTAAEVMIRSTELEDLKSVEKRIRECMLAAASASGCTTEIHLMAAVKPVKFSQTLFDSAAENMRSSGETLERLPLWEATSDFGDVSHEVPALGLLYKTHDENTCWHSKDAAVESAGDAANEAMLRASKILADTAIDILFGKLK